MMILLPLAAVGCLALVLGAVRPAWGWRRVLLRAVLLSGLYLTFITEGLGRLGLLRQAPLALAWAVPALALAGCLARLGWRRAWRPPRLVKPLGRGEAILAAGILVILLVTAVVAFLAPPQTWDSLNYHMARVAHWAQQGSVKAFATGIEVQNSRPPGAEYGVLHAYVLAQSDRWVNFVAWWAMVVSVVGVSLVARQLGASRPAQLGAAAFLATLPMALIQASSTMTDMIVAVWMVAAASEALTLAEDTRRWEAAFFLAAAAALAAFTKPTAFPYLLGVAAPLSVHLLRRGRLRQALAYAALAALVVISVNGGYWSRMLNLYGSLQSPHEVELHRNGLMTPAGVASNLVRHIALEVGTPWRYPNRAAVEAVLMVHRLLGLDPSDPRTTAHEDFTIPPLNVSETKAGSPLHALLAMAAAGLVILRLRSFSREILGYGAGLLLAALAFSLIFKWQVFASRYHLPFFALLAPWLGAIASRRLPSAWILGLAAGLMLACFPWLTGIRTRPLLPWWDEPKVGSLLVEDRTSLVFAGGKYLQIPYTEMAALIRQQGCLDVGLMLGGNAAEYPVWFLLGAPRDELRIEWLVGGTPSAALADADFNPCAILCAGCEEQGVTIRDLPLDYERSGYRLYMDTEG